MGELVLGLLDRGGLGLAALAAIGLGFAIWKLMARRTSLTADMRNDLIAAKAENRELEAKLDEERARRRKAEDERDECERDRRYPAARHRRDDDAG